MKKELLEKAREEIEKEMNRVGFIDDSDNCDRFLDELSRNLAEKVLVPNDDIELYYEKEAEIEELSEELLEMIKDEIMIEYNKIDFINERGDYTGCYYSTKKDAVRWANNWQEQDIVEAHKEFVEIYGLDVTLEQFMEAYDIEIEDYLENN